MSAEHMRSVRDTDGQTHESIADLEQEIEHHRHEVDRTLDSLERRLTPGQLLDQAVGNLWTNGGGEYVRNLGVAVKRNPVPVALLGVGLGWLMASGTSPAGYLSGSDRDRDSGDSRLDKLRDSMSSAAGSAAEKGQSLKESAAEKRQSMRDKADELGARARSGADQVARTARRSANAASRGYDYVVREQPLAMGAVGLTLGMLLGLGLPETDTENEMMGEKRDELLHQAKQTGAEKLEQAKPVAQAAIERGKEAAKSEVERQEKRRRAGSETAP